MSLCFSFFNLIIIYLQLYDVCSTLYVTKGSWYRQLRGPNVRRLGPCWLLWPQLRASVRCQFCRTVPGAPTSPSQGRRALLLTPREMRKPGAGPTAVLGPGGELLLDAEALAGLRPGNVSGAKQSLRHSVLAMRKQQQSQSRKGPGNGSSARLIQGISGRPCMDLAHACSGCGGGGLK